MKQPTESTSLLYTTDLAITEALSWETDELKGIISLSCIYFHGRNVCLTLLYFQHLFVELQQGCKMASPNQKQYILEN